MIIMKNLLVMLLLVLTTLSGCEENTRPNSDEVLIFGVAYGYCVGDCAHFFQIKEGALFKDNIARYPEEELHFDKDPLPEDKYQVAKSLLTQFPEFLKERPNETIGCPDCADQGGYHLILNMNNAIQYWHIDTSVDSQPAEIRAYMDQVRTVLEQLQD
ncbi:MAG TPA: hypothetical protein PKN99_06540 [Cyclobacteriaceae bacterium]|nr:hypothetical protein [Cyclobacteriaceae bacterium]